jgi:hypothetical protein
VGEGKPVAGVLKDTRPHRILQRRRELEGGAAECRRQLRRPERQAQDRAGLDSAPGRLGQRPEPTDDQHPERVRQAVPDDLGHPTGVLEGALLDHRSGQFHQVQGIPRRAAEKLQQPLAGLQTGQVTDQPHRGVLGEAAEPDVGGSQPQEVVDGARHSGRMLRADRDHDRHRPKREPPSQPPDRGQRGGVGPLQVVHRQQQRVGGRQPLQAVAELLHQAIFGWLGRRRGLVAGAWPVALADAGQGVKQRPQGPAQGLLARRWQTAETVASGPGDELIDQARLADPGGPLQHRDGRRPGPRPVQAGGQRLQLNVPAKQPGRGPAPRDHVDTW